MHTKNIDLLQLSVEGFRSYVNPISIDLDGLGLTLIKGINGEGKSSLFSALSWCLYKINLNGTVNDKVKSWSWIRGKDYRGVRVVTTLRVTGSTEDGCYMIARHLDFKGNTKKIKGNSSLFIFRRDDDFDFTESDLLSDEQYKGDQQAYINRVLGVDSRMFLNSILFGQKMARLVSSPNDDKRKLFEAMFDLAFIESAKKKAQLKKSELSQEVAVLRANIDGCGQELYRMRISYREKEELLTTFDNGKKDRIKAITDEIKETDAELTTALDKEREVATKLHEAGNDQDLTDIKQNYENYKNSVSDTTDTIREYEASNRTTVRELHTATENVANFKEQLANVKVNCPTCGKPLSADKIEPAKASLRKQIEAEESVIKVLTANQEKNNAKLRELTSTLLLEKERMDNAWVAYDKIKNELTKIEEWEKELTHTRSDISFLKTTIEKLKARAQTEADVKPPKIDLAAMQREIDEVELKSKKLTEEEATKSQKLVRVNWWVDKAFGASGLKAFVFSAMLTQLNIHMDKYAKRLGYRCKFWIDLSKVSKPFMTTCFVGENEVDYNELSGGQQQLLDVVVSFAMHDIMCGMSNFNVLILDEVFEGLSENNVEAVFDLIRTKSEAGKSVFVITHSELIDSMGSKSLYVARDEFGATYIT